MVSAIKAGRWPILIAVLAVGLAVGRGEDSAWIAGFATAWASMVFLTLSAAELAGPANWHLSPVCRGTHPGRCSLTIDVNVGEEQPALSLATYLHGRGVRATFFLDAGIIGLVPSLQALDHEIGCLNTGPRHLPPYASWIRTTTAWQNRNLPAALRRVAWSIELGPRASLSEASRVVGTDIVRISARTPVPTLSSWLNDWDARAVVASPLSATLSQAR